MERCNNIINDENPKNNWEVIDCQNGFAWLHFSTIKRLDNSNIDTYVSTVYEVNLNINKRQIVKLVNNSYRLWHMYISTNYIYAIITVYLNESLCNCYRQLVRLNRKNGIIEELWAFKENIEATFISKVLDDNYILLYILYKSNGDIIERYDLFNVSANEYETIYIDNEEMIEPKIFLSAGSNGLLILFDLHITPSDKCLCTGNSDRIFVCERKTTL